MEEAQSMRSAVAAESLEKAEEMAEELAQLRANGPAGRRVQVTVHSTSALVAVREELTRAEQEHDAEEQELLDCTALLGTQLWNGV